MCGLLLKDILNLKQQFRIYAIIILMWVAIGLSNNDPAYIGGLMLMLTVLVPSSAAGYDEKAKWDRYALTMPISRRDMVVSKYLLAVITALLGGIISVAAGFFMPCSVAENLIVNAVLASLGLIAVSVTLPAVFKYGVEKSRLIMMAVLLIPLLLGAVISKLNINLPNIENSEKPLMLLPAAAVAAVLASAAISVKIYNKKEF